MLQNFAYYAQIMLHMQANILHEFNTTFLLSYLNHKIMNSYSSHYLCSYFPTTVHFVCQVSSPTV